MRYEPNDNPLAPAFHVIADHLRALAFAIADGAEPSNTERGYVLRKILRRALRYGRRLDLNRPFLAKLLPTLIDRMGSDFHELKTASNRIEELLTLEEESFIKIGNFFRIGLRFFLTNHNQPDTYKCGEPAEPFVGFQKFIIIASTGT